MSGTITLSLEIELAWGLNHCSLDDERFGRFSPGRKAETRTLRRLLELCDLHGVPFTFDIVGHLFEDECDGNHAGPHERGWFENDPGTNRDVNPLHYAPDLVDDIRNADVDHEICTHTFSHVPCDQVSRDVVAWEIEAAAKRHVASGLSRPQSFVPPMHRPPPMDVLREHGIKTVRMPTQFEPPVRDRPTPDSLLKRIPWHIQNSHAAQVLFRSHPVCNLYEVDGVVVSQSTWHHSLSAPYLPNGQEKPHPVYRAIPTSIRQRIHNRYLDDALRRTAGQSAHAHFWTHLFNVSNEAQWEPLERFVQQLSRYRDAGQIEISTMDTLASVPVESFEAAGDGVDDVLGGCTVDDGR